VLHRATSVLCAVCACLVVLPAGRAFAAFPGRNGVIAFAGQLSTGPCRGEVDIFTVWPDGQSHVHQLTSHCRSAYGDAAPAYSPNGSRIAFVHAGPGCNGHQLDIVVMTSNGRHRRQITRSCPRRRNASGVYLVTENTSPEFSRNGRKIVYARSACHYNIALRTLTQCVEGIYTMTIKGKHQRLIHRNGYDPEFSPNGKLIVFDAFRGPIRRKEIFIMTADGGHVRQLTHRPGANRGSPVPVGSELPDFSPNGKRIAFISTPSNDCRTEPGVAKRICANSTDLFTIKVNGKGLHKVSDTGATYNRPCYSPDGAEIDAGGIFYPARGGPSEGRVSLPEEGCSWQPLRHAEDHP
jgi:Tol biopolymer transport system component